MVIAILGVLVVAGIVVMIVLRSKSIKSDARRIEEQSKRRNES
jgi:hypothetical protein